MGRPAGVPRPQPDQPAKPGDGGGSRQQPGHQSLSAGQAMWWELADGLYLASIMDRSGPLAAKDDTESAAAKHVPPPQSGHPPPPAPEDIGPQESQKAADHRAVEAVQHTVTA